MENQNRLQVKVTGNKAKLIGNIDRRLEQQLRDEFCWLSPNDLTDVVYFYTDRVMYRGIATSVVNYLNYNGYDCDLVFSNLPPKDFEAKFLFTFREFQEEAKNVAIAQRTGICQLPVRVGKTVIFSSIIAELGYNTIILVEENAPFANTKKQIEEATDISHVGMVGDNIHDIQPVTVCMVQTIAAKLRLIYTYESVVKFWNGEVNIDDIFIGDQTVKDIINDYELCECEFIEDEMENEDNFQKRLEEWMKELSSSKRLVEAYQVYDLVKNTKVVIIDEAHNAVSDWYLEVFNTLGTNLQYLIGVTATPFREDDRHEYLQAMMGDVIYQKSYGDAIDAGLILPFTIIVDHCKPKNYGYTEKDNYVSAFIRRKQYRKVYKEYIIENDDRNKMYADFVKWCTDQNMSCAVIVKEVKHGEKLAKFIPNAVQMYSNMKSSVRKATYDKLRNKEILCVITTLMEEATDIPSLDAVAIAAGGKNKKTLYQRMRSLTKFEGETAIGYTKKDRAWVYLTYDNTDFLKSHSYTNEKNLRALVKEHKDNEIIILK